MLSNRMFQLSPLATFVIAMAPTFGASAAGFQVNEHSAAGLGRAFAGEAAIADDASVVARNAAAISFLDRAMFTGAVSYIKPEIEVESSVSGPLPSPQGTDKRVAGEAVVPVFYYTRPLDEKLSFGVGGFTNFGFTTDYSTSSGVTTIADLSEVRSYNLAGSLAYKLQDNLSVGFGVDAVYVDARLSSTLGFNTGSAPAGSNLIDVAGDAWGFGWNTGIFWRPTGTTRLGASYRSQIKTTLEGRATSVDPRFNSRGSVDLTLPWIAELSLWQQLTDRTAVHASYSQFGWSSFDQIVINLDNNQTPPVDTHNYRNSSRWSLGTTYQYSDALTLRAGYAYDNSPVSNEHRSFRIPDTDRQWFTLGGGYQIDSQQSVDFGYAFVQGENEKIEAQGTGTLSSFQFGGEIKNGNAHIVSVQYNYAF